MSPALEKKIIAYGLPVLLCLFITALILADAVFFPREGTPSGEEIPEQPTAETSAAETESEPKKAEEGLFDDEKGLHYRLADGSLYTGWLRTSAGVRYFDESGTAVMDGFVTAEGKKYAFKDGYALKGWQELSGRLWFFAEDLSAQYGLLERDGKKVFLKEDGSLAAGEQEINGTKYFFGEDGSLKEGWDGDRYFVRGYAAQGFLNVDGTGRFFLEDGTMARGGRFDRYDVDENGAAVDHFPEISHANLEEYTEFIFEKYGNKLWNIYCFVRYNFAYVYREEAEEEEMVLRMLNTGLGSCYDYAALMHYLYTNAGYECVVVRGKGTFHDEHAWVMVLLPNGLWRHVDPIWQVAEVYCLTDEELIALDADPENNCTYEWDPSLYPRVEPAPAQ